MSRRPLRRHSLARACRCAHERSVHEHYRAGTDCSQCPPGACRRYRPSRAVRAEGVLAEVVTLPVAWTERISQSATSGSSALDLSTSGSAHSTAARPTTARHLTLVK